MAENKTKPTDVSVELYLAAVEPAGRREDALAVDALMRRVSGEEPQMWGPSIIGYGRTTLHYDSGRVVDAPVVAFSPRKASLVFYLGTDAGEPLLGKLGKHTAGKSCLYVNRLVDVDAAVLEALVRQTVERHA
ncbi:MAG: DUF1801 domain-containing protein [Bauldia sp.]|nr:DUF1801 domain-containing protein [Bauldia sp.]